MEVPPGFSKYSFHVCNYCENVAKWPEKCREEGCGVCLHFHCIPYHLYHAHMTPKLNYVEQKLDTLLDLMGYMPGGSKAQEAEKHFYESQQ